MAKNRVFLLLTFISLVSLLAPQLSWAQQFNSGYGLWWTIFATVQQQQQAKSQPKAQAEPPTSINRDDLKKKIASNIQEADQKLKELDISITVAEDASHRVIGHFADREKSLEELIRNLGILKQKIEEQKKILSNLYNNYDHLSPDAIKTKLREAQMSIAVMLLKKGDPAIDPRTRRTGASKVDGPIQGIRRQLDYLYSTEKDPETKAGLAQNIKDLEASRNNLIEKAKELGSIVKPEFQIKPPVR